jgi:hypothetical protein
MKLPMALALARRARLGAPRLGAGEGRQLGSARGLSAAAAADAAQQEQPSGAADPLGAAISTQLDALRSAGLLSAEGGCLLGPSPAARVRC